MDLIACKRRQLFQERKDKAIIGRLQMKVHDQNVTYVACVAHWNQDGWTNFHICPAEVTQPWPFPGYEISAAGVCCSA